VTIVSGAKAATILADTDRINNDTSFIFRLWNEDFSISLLFYHTTVVVVVIEIQDTIIQ
jgi:hypothetical protein